MLHRFVHHMAAVRIAGYAAYADDQPFLVGDGHRHLGSEPVAPKGEMASSQPLRKINSVLARRGPVYVPLRKEEFLHREPHSFLNRMFLRIISTLPVVRITEPLQSGPYTSGKMVN